MNTPMSPKVVLFDYGGVLAEEGFAEGLKAIAAAQGLDPGRFFSQVEKIIYDCGYVTGGNSEAGFWARVRAECGIVGGDAELTGQIQSRFVLRPGMLALVRGLKARGVRTAILSDQTDWLEQLDRRDHFLAEFDPVLNSYYLGHSKRESATFHLALQRLGVPAAQVLFVDDNGAHIGRAVALGLQVHHFADEAAFAAELRQRGLAGPEGVR
ncbi:MAG TPA: HAD family phosphatase [Desulfurivibrionaceae bacterium]|nr:HAD family phosphatase [Desulfurivibrionaceae bacterium]